MINQKRLIGKINHVKNRRDHRRVTDMSDKMNEDYRKAIRDPIHGLIPRRPTEISLMDTHVFQRLRRIRQLALAHLVYPGAVNTRFEHSVGTMHIAGLMCERLRDFAEFDEEEMNRIRAAALLHDIGQGPFSHVSEFLLELHSDRCSLAVKDTAKIHEIVTTDIIMKNKEIADILPDQDKESIVRLIKGSQLRDFRHDIISSSLDADKMDYLIRDSYYAGVRYGQYDLEKIIDSLRIYSRGAESFLVVDHEGVYALEQLVLAKHHMTQQVYAHRVRCITDAMIVRGIQLAIGEGNEELLRLYRYDGTERFIDNYLDYHDEKVIDLACSQSDSPKARTVFLRLKNRCLFKQVCGFELRQDEIPNVLVRGDLVQLERGAPLQRELEKSIADRLRIDPDYVIVYRRKVKDPSYLPVGYGLDEEETYVLRKNNEPEKLREFPDLVFSLKKEQEPAPQVNVYAPMERWKQWSQEDKSALQEELKTIIVETTESNQKGRGL